MQQRNGAPEAGEEVAQRDGEASQPTRKRRSLRPLLRLLPFVTRYKGMLAAALISLVIAACATLALPMGIRRMIDLGFSPENAGFIDQYFAMMAAIGVVLAAASAARFYTVNWLGERVIADLREEVFAHLTKLSPGFYDITHSAEVMSRLTADTTQMKAVVGTIITQTLRNLVLIVGSITMMMVTSLKLSGLVLAVIPLIVLPLVASGAACAACRARLRTRLPTRRPTPATISELSVRCRPMPTSRPLSSGSPGRWNAPCRRPKQDCGPALY